MSLYASATGVSIERSQEQLKAILRRYGAKGFAQFEMDDKAAIAFEFHNMLFRIGIPLPCPTDEQFNQTDCGRKRKQAAAFAAYEQAVRQRWRALLLAIKAKLEAVESGISSLETEFLPFIVLPNNETLGSYMMPRLEEALKAGHMPRLALPGPSKE